MSTSDFLNDDVISTRVIGPYHLFYKKNGIVFLRITGEIPETVELGKKMVEVLGEMVNYKKVPLLCQYDSGVIPPKENRDFWAKADACPYSSVDAFIVNSLAFRLIANFYLHVNRPERATQFFSNTADATAWLMSYVDAQSVQTLPPMPDSIGRRMQR